MKEFLFTMMLATAVASLALYFVTAQPLVRPILKKVPPVSPERLQSHVRMLSETLQLRSVGNLTNLEEAANYVHKEFATSGAHVSNQWFEDHGEKFRNVIARFGPALFAVGL